MRREEGAEGSGNNILITSANYITIGGIAVGHLRAVADMIQNGNWR